MPIRIRLSHISHQETEQIFGRSNHHRSGIDIASPGVQALPMVRLLREPAGLECAHARGRAKLEKLVNVSQDNHV
eukprot:CAMPEP_0181416210 /NCGR_PEP_ID=MMETSP1110-20121109/10406_1 /TAXON_ID=174948 /ORGANISM="Symbiodinium sp., Strain CCMP421" /LENGTH=74 /DNA_ID=CAMNT_0023539119 /DNA_START=713 /DNA_END=937 /DNA_ORIENTATION=-